MKYVHSLQRYAWKSGGGGGFLLLFPELEIQPLPPFPAWEPCSNTAEGEDVWRLLILWKSQFGGLLRGLAGFGGLLKVLLGSVSQNSC